jgi:hypothetical protein
LADTFRSVGLRRYIEQPLIGFGILHDRFGLSVDGKNQRFSRLFQSFRNFADCGEMSSWPECLF